MVRKTARISVFVLILAAMLLSACSPKATTSGEGFTFGILMVGPYNDHGWSQAHYEAGLYVEEKLGAKMIYIDKVNSADRPGTTPDQLAGDVRRLDRADRRRRSVRRTRDPASVAQRR